MLSFKVKKASTLWENIVGLLGEDKPYPLLLKTRFGIHTFFMKYPIDVVILDSQNRVKALKINLKPWRVYFWNPKYQKVLELPANTIRKYRFKVGDSVTI